MATHTRPYFNPATHTLYVPFLRNNQGIPTFNDQIAVIDASTCNAYTSSGCGQKPANIPAGQFATGVGLNRKTDTLYVAVDGSSLEGHTVWVINGATCNATDQSGCGQVAAKAKVGFGPVGVAVDEATNSVYVSNAANGDRPGTVSVINATTCNATNTTSCAGSAPTIPVGGAPVGIAIDSRANRIYVADSSSAAVSVIDGRHCNAIVRTACSKPAPEQAVGSLPGAVLVNQNTGTVYVTTSGPGGTRRISIFGSSP